MQADFNKEVGDYFTDGKKVQREGHTYYVFRHKSGNIAKMELVFLKAEGWKGRPKLVAWVEINEKAGLGEVRKLKKKKVA